MQSTRCASNVHAIIRRGKNEGTVGEWMRWTFFPPFCLSSSLFARRVLVHCRFCCRCCTTPPQRNAESVAESRLGLRLFYMWSNHHLLLARPPVVALLPSFLLLFSAPSSLERNNVSRNAKLYLTRNGTEPVFPLEYPRVKLLHRLTLYRFLRIGSSKQSEGGARSRLNVNSNHPVTCRFRIPS